MNLSVVFVPQFCHFKTGSGHAAILRPAVMRLYDAMGLSHLPRSLIPSVSHGIARLANFCVNLHSGTWPFYRMDLLSLRLVGEVGARITVRRSYSQRWPTATCIRTKVLTVSNPVRLPLSYPVISLFLPRWLILLLNHNFPVYQLS